MQTYLQLPEDLPKRLVELANGLVMGSTTPYDRVRAIESYLRKVPYSLDVPEPPKDQDVVDYYLFDLKQGYCDYSASALVVLARAAGIPARLVMGYAQGAYDAQNQVYVVTEADAHSWPEVYFTGIGWVEFEPTAAQPEIVRPENPLANPPAACAANKTVPPAGLAAHWEGHPGVGRAGWIDLSVDPPLAACRPVVAEPGAGQRRPAGALPPPASFGEAPGSGIPAGRHAAGICRDAEP